jgi:hypothetical protein
MAKEFPITRQPRQHPNSICTGLSSKDCFPAQKKQKFPNEPNFPQAKLMNVKQNGLKTGSEKAEINPKKTPKSRRKHCKNAKIRCPSSKNQREHLFLGNP